MDKCTRKSLGTKQRETSRQTQKRENKKQTKKQIEETHETCKDRERWTRSEREIHKDTQRYIERSRERQRGTKNRETDFQRLSEGIARDPQTEKGRNKTRI